jgi:hypothetical protein
MLKEPFPPLLFVIFTDERPSFGDFDLGEAQL